MANLQKTVIVPDVSFYQDDNTTPAKIDFQKMKSAGAAGVIIRMGQNNWLDEDFTYNWQKALEAGLPRGCYWYYDSRSTPVSQATRVANLLNANGRPEMELWCDYEESFGGSYGGWKNFAVFIAEIEKQLPGVKVGIYTGYYYWAVHSPNPNTETAAFNWFAKYPLWLAWYTNDTTIVKCPAPWTKITYWQFTAVGSGPAYGVESKGIDLSYFNGTIDDFNDRYAIGHVDPPIDPPETISVRIVSVVDAANNIKVPAVLKVSVSVNNTLYINTIDQRGAVIIPTGIYRIKDDIEANQLPVRNGFPSTVRCVGGTGAVQLSPAWMKYAISINPGRAYNYQFDNDLFKKAIGWHNVGDGNRVEELTFSGNVVKVLRIGDIVNDVLVNTDRAYIETFFNNQTPPAVVLPMPGALQNYRVHNFSIQYSNRLDMSTDGRYARTFLIANPGEQLYIDKSRLVKV